MSVDQKTDHKRQYWENWCPEEDSNLHVHTDTST